MADLMGWESGTLGPRQTGATTLSARPSPGPDPAERFRIHARIIGTGRWVPAALNHILRYHPQ